ncbi:hypothetical protein BD560DRAFT_375596 [Blakeslea trispora]|nr:hypothetical protein BD560DRAFT_375596 [Blakeslea trispora]
MNSSSAHNSILRFTLDGRPSIEDIHDLFSTLMFQLKCSTNRFMFRSYTNSFTSEQALTILGSLSFTQMFRSNQYNLTASVLSSTSSTVDTMDLGMSKALIQQFLWTRLIFSATEPRNRTYKDKSIWKISSKGLCVLQGFSAKTKTNIEKFECHINASAQLMFLIQVERKKDSDRLNNKRRHMASLFSIMIASLPLKKEYQTNKSDCHSDRASLTEDYHFSSSKNSTYSGYEPSFSSQELSFADYFPNTSILSNNVLMCAYGSNQQLTKSLDSSPQNILLQNLEPSSTSNKLQMRTIFTSSICCNWLVDYCTIASNDEAESVMTDFMHLGWIAYYDKKNDLIHQVESSNSVTLNLTRSGMKIVIDMSMERYRDSQSMKLYQQQLDELCMLEDDHSKHDLLRKTEATATSYLHHNHSIYHSEANEEKERYYAKSRISFPSIYTSTSCDSSMVSMNKLHLILANPYLWSLFRDFLEDYNCGEIIEFWTDYKQLCKSYQEQKTVAPSENMDQLLEDGFLIWEMYLKPNAQLELNMDDNFKNEMAREMNSMMTVVGTTSPNYSSANILLSTFSTAHAMETVISWFDKVNNHVLNLMTMQFLPSFTCSTQYKKLLQQLQQKQIDRSNEEFDTSLQKTLRKRSTVLSYTPPVVGKGFNEFPLPPQRHDSLKEVLRL